MVEDLPFELGEEGARLEAELLAQHRATLPVHLERVRLAAGPVESDHELPPELLPERVVGDERLQLGHELGVVTEFQLGLDPLFGGGKAQLLQSGDLELSPLLVLELLERTSPPQRKRPPEGVDRFVRLLLGCELGEPLELDRVGVGRREHVAGAPRQDGVGGRARRSCDTYPCSTLCALAAVDPTTARRSAARRRPARSRARARARAARADDRPPPAAPRRPREPRVARGCRS